MGVYINLNHAHQHSVVAMLSAVVPPLLLTVECVLALLLAVYLLHRYANIRRQNPFTTVTTLVVWFLSFVIIFLLPVDVSSVSGDWSREWGGLVSLLVPFSLCFPSLPALSPLCPSLYHTHTHTHSQAFYRQCLSSQQFNITSSNLSVGSCKSYVCDDRPFYLVDNGMFNYSEVCDTQCYQPVSFVCKFPLLIVWYIIYWLFFVLSW